MNLKLYFIIVGIVALFGEIIFDNAIFRMVIAGCLGFILGDEIATMRECELCSQSDCTCVEGEK